MKFTANAHTSLMRARALCRMLLISWLRWKTSVSSSSLRLSWLQSWKKSAKSFGPLESWGPWTLSSPVNRLWRYATDCRKLMMELADWISSDLSPNSHHHKPGHAGYVLRLNVERLSAANNNCQQLHSESMVWHDPVHYIVESCPLTKPASTICRWRHSYCYRHLVNIFTNVFRHHCTCLLSSKIFHPAVRNI